jgi:hypothetical protein
MTEGKDSKKKTPAKKELRGKSGEEIAASESHAGGMAGADLVSGILEGAMACEDGLWRHALR